MKHLPHSLFLLLSFCTALHAQVDVDVRTQATVGVGPIGGIEGVAAAETVTADLKRTGMIAPVSGGSGDFVASGDASDAGLNGKLVDKKSGKELFSQTFSGKPRSAAHQFADAITLAVTGLPGFASSKIAFISSASGSKELYLADIDGFNARQVTHDGVICASPSLSRDGSKVAYTSYKSGYADVYLIDIATGTRNRVAYFPGINSGPAFSPDGAELALTLSKDGNPEIYTMPAGGGSPTRITRTRGSETSPAWSPTGDRLVYSSDDHGSPQLYVSTAGGVGDQDRLVTGNGYCTKPDWSPDGKWICFTTRIGGQFQIGVYNVASRQGRVVTSSGGQDPAWTRDSRHLLYSNGGRLYLLDTVSGQSLPIETNAKGSGEPTVTR